jgi:hypothetical protein
MALKQMVEGDRPLGAWQFVETPGVVAPDEWPSWTEDQWKLQPPLRITVSLTS